MESYPKRILMYWEYQFKYTNRGNFFTEKTEKNCFSNRVLKNKLLLFNYHRHKN